MSRTSSTLTLPLAPRRPGAKAHVWLVDGIRRAILEGVFQPGARLPSTRDLARDYELARGTVVRAFDQLRAEGYVHGAIGSGTFVRGNLPDDLLHVASSASHRQMRQEPSKRRLLSDYAKRAKLFPASSPARTRAFRANQPALDLFPMSTWARLAARRVRRAPTKLLRETEPFGYQPLREAVADYLRLARGVRCSWQQVAIVTGVQEALDLAARVFLRAGDRVCVEDPGYVGATRLFEAYGARISYMSIDVEGPVVPRPSVHDVRLAYVTPAHQFPLGVTMSIARRLALLDWARRSGALIFEDDYDSEYRYSGRPIPALQGLDTRGSVLFAGTFSKVLFPSLRLGYLVVPPDLVERIAAVKSLSTRHAPVLEQAIVCDFMAEGYFARHLRRMREVYAERISVLVDYGRERLDGLLDISGVEAGLQTVGWLPKNLSDVKVARAAQTRDVEVVPLSVYSRKGLTREGLQLGFAAVDPPELRRGVRELERVLTTLT